MHALCKVQYRHALGCYQTILSSYASAMRCPVLTAGTGTRLPGDFNFDADDASRVEHVAPFPPLVDVPN
eukprot:2642472-Rhodomonas_salina.7